MKTIERKSMWHHTVFSGVLCLILIALLLVHHDVPTVLLGVLIVIYIAGNSLIHYLHRDFRTETMWEYLLIGGAVFVVLVSAFNH